MLKIFKKITLSLTLSGLLISSTAYTARPHKPSRFDIFKKIIKTVKRFPRRHPAMAAIVIGACTWWAKNKIFQGLDHLWDKATGNGNQHENQQIQEHDIKTEKAEDIKGFDQIDNDAVEQGVKDLNRDIDAAQAVKKANKIGFENLENLRNQNDRRNNPLAHIGEGDIPLPHFILLEGPSQTGKSTTAKALAKKLGAKEVISLRGPQLDSKWVGGSVQLLHRLFRQAERMSSENHPAVIIIDEIDGALYGANNRHHADGNNSTATKIAHSLQGLFDDIVDKKKNIYVIATTNHLDRMNQEANPIITRFQDATVHVPLPNEAKRRSLLKHFINENNLEIENEDAFVNQQAVQTDGWDIRRIKNHVTDLKKAELQEDIARIKEVTDQVPDQDVPQNFFDKITKPVVKVAHKVKTYLENKVKAGYTWGKSFIVAERPAQEPVKIRLRLAPRQNQAQPQVAQNPYQNTPAQDLPEVDPKIANKTKKLLENIIQEPQENHQNNASKLSVDDIKNLPSTNTEKKDALEEDNPEEKRQKKEKLKN